MANADTSTLQTAIDAVDPSTINAEDTWQDGVKVHKPDIHNEFVVIRTSVSALKDALSAALAVDDTLISDIEAVEASLTTLSNTVDNLDIPDISTLESDVSTLSSTVTQHTTDIDDLEAAVVEADEGITIINTVARASCTWDGTNITFNGVTSDGTSRPWAGALDVFSDTVDPANGGSFPAFFNETTDLYYYTGE